MKKIKLALALLVITSCEKINYNINNPVHIDATEDTITANSIDITKFDFDLGKKPHKNQTVFISTTLGKLYSSPVINIETEGMDSITLTPNQKKFPVYLKAGRSFNGDRAIITAIVNGYLISNYSITFLPSCPKELIASINKDTLALNSNQDFIEGEIVAYCNSGSVSDDIRINYLLSDSSVIDINPKILKTSNETIEFTLIPKKMGTTQIEFYTDITGCDSIISNKISIKVY